MICAFGTYVMICLGNNIDTKCAVWSYLIKVVHMEI